jgi:hypothetical protein
LPEERHEIVQHGARKDFLEALQRLIEFESKLSEANA